MGKNAAGSPFANLLRNRNTLYSRREQKTLIIQLQTFDWKVNIVSVLYSNYTPSI